MRRRRHVGRRAGTGTAARGVAIVDELGFVPFERTGGELLGALERRRTWTLYVDALLSTTG